MAKRIVEERRRGVAGWLFLAIFWLANSFMAVIAYISFSSFSQTPHPQNGAEAAGTVIGASIVVYVVLVIWALVALLTGLFAFMTRGRKEWIEIDS